MSHDHRLDEIETTELLGAVDDLDQIRGILADGERLEPPKLRDDLLKLHGIAMRVCNEGWDDEKGELLDLAMDIDDEVTEIRDAAERILLAVRQVTDAKDYLEEDENEDW